MTFLCKCLDLRSVKVFMSIVGGLAASLGRNGRARHVFILAA